MRQINGDEASIKIKTNRANMKKSSLLFVIATNFMEFSNRGMNHNKCSCDSKFRYQINTLKECRVHICPLEQLLLLLNKNRQHKKKAIN